MRVHTEEQPRDAVFDITGIKYLREIKAPLLLRANAYHVWAFAVSPIYSSLYTPAWVVNLGSGIGVQFVAFVLGVIFNTIVTASLCEMISTIPSSGGVVGFGRVALGHLVGFLCGVIECVGLFTSTAIAAILWGQYIQDTFNTSEKFLILWSTLTLACSCSVIIVGGRKMWDFILITGVLSTFILLLYLISAMVGGNFDDNAFQQSLPTDDLINGHHSAVVDTDRVWFSGGMSAWYIALPNSFWMMGGIECIGVIGEEVINAPVAVPRGAMVGALCGYLAFIFATFAGASLPPGIGALSLSQYPIADGLMALFPGLSSSASLGIVSLGAVANITPWFFALSRQVFALSRKGFLPSALSRVNQGLPYSSLIFVTILSYVLIIMTVVVKDATYEKILNDVDYFAANLLYLWITVLYVVLKYRYLKTHEAKFQSPFGITGAILAICFYLICFGFYVAETPDIGISFGVLVGLHLVWMTFYYFVSRNNLVMDEDERRAIITTLDLDKILKTEFGFAYLEHHCVKELNSESLYCLHEAHQLLLLGREELSLVVFKKFCEKYIFVNADMQVNISANMREKFVKYIKKEEMAAQRYQRKPSLASIREDITGIADNLGRRMSSVMARSSVSTGRRISKAINSTARYSVAREHREERVPNLMPSVGSELSVDPDQLGGLLDSRQAHLLHLLEKELVNLINLDIIPRWLRSSEAVERFLDNQPMVRHMLTIPSLTSPGDNESLLCK